MSAHAPVLPLSEQISQMQSRKASLEAQLSTAQASLQAAQGKLLVGSADPGEVAEALGTVTALEGALRATAEQLADLRAHEALEESRKRKAALRQTVGSAAREAQQRREAILKRIAQIARMLEPEFRLIMADLRAWAAAREEFRRAGCQLEPSLTARGWASGTTFATADEIEADRRLDALLNELRAENIDLTGALTPVLQLALKTSRDVPTDLLLPNALSMGIFSLWRRWQAAQRGAASLGFWVKES